MIESVIEGRGTIGDAVDRAPLRARTADESPQAAAPVAPQLLSAISTSLTDVIFLLR